MRRILVLSLFLTVFAQMAEAAIHSAAFPAVVRKFNAEEVEVEAQQMKFTVPRSAIKSGVIKVGEAVSVTLEGDVFIRFSEQLEHALVKSRKPSNR